MMPSNVVCSRCGASVEFRQSGRHTPVDEHKCRDLANTDFLDPSFSHRGIFDCPSMCKETWPPDWVKTPHSQEAIDQNRKKRVERVNRNQNYD